MYNGKDITFLVMHVLYNGNLCNKIPKVIAND